MDELRFDALTRRLTISRSRRGALGVLAAVLATATGAALPATGAAEAGDDPEAGRNAKQGGNGNSRKGKRCRKVGQACGGKKKCCKGLDCQNGTCANPQQPECSVDADCDFNETCDGGTCACDLRVNGTCVRRCESQSDCPGPAGCRNRFPEESPFIEDGVCILDPFLLCSGTVSCDSDNDCQGGEICVGLACGTADQVTFRCIPIAVGDDFEN